MPSVKLHISYQECFTRFFYWYYRWRMECGQASVTFQEKTLDVIKKTETERGTPELWKPKTATALQQLVYDHSQETENSPRSRVWNHRKPITRFFDYALCTQTHKSKHLNPGDLVKDAGLLTFMREGQFDE